MPCEPGMLARLAYALLPPDDTHGRGHAERVLAYARLIAEVEGITDRVDWGLVELCVALHDVGRFLPGEGHHAEKSAALARDLLRTAGCSEELVERVVNCILSHSYSLGVRPETLEAILVSDADKLDAIGAVGVYRVVWESGRRGRGIRETLEHYREKLSRLSGLLRLEASRRIAERLEKRLRAYFEWLEDELRMLERHRSPHVHSSNTMRRSSRTSSSVSTSTR